MALLLGLLRTDLLAKDISAVTRVIDILQEWDKQSTDPRDGKKVKQKRKHYICLTCHQICAWESQRVPSASYQSPAQTSFPFSMPLLLFWSFNPSIHPSTHPCIHPFSSAYLRACNQCISLSRDDQTSTPLKALQTMQRDRISCIRKSGSP